MKSQPLEPSECELIGTKNRYDSVKTWTCLELPVKFIHKPIGEWMCKSCAAHKLRHKTLDEAIAFAKKYLANRRDSYVIPEKCKICGELFIDYHIHEADTPSGTTTRENKSAKAWDVAVEYILLDIIPYLYGEALD